MVVVLRPKHPLAQRLVSICEVYLNQSTLTHFRNRFSDWMHVIQTAENTWKGCNVHCHCLSRMLLRYRTVHITYQTTLVHEEKVKYTLFDYYMEFPKFSLPKFLLQEHILSKNSIFSVLYTTKIKALFNFFKKKTVIKFAHCCFIKAINILAITQFFMIL